MSTSTLTIDEVEEQRIERGIRKTHFSIVVGYQTDRGWETAVRRQSVSEKKLENALDVFEYYDENGYLPEP